MISLLIAGVVIVSPAGPVTRLRDAVARAHPGDTIVVRPGRYHEDSTVVVDRRLVIRGEGGPVFEGGDHTFILVTANDVTVEGLEVTGIRPSSTDDRAAIKLDRVSGCVVRANRISRAFFGIYGAKVNGCLIEDNRIVGPGPRNRWRGTRFISGRPPE